MENGHYVTKNRYAIPDKSEAKVLIVNLVEYDNDNNSTRHGAENDEIAMKAFFENHTNCKGVQIERKATADTLLNPTNGIIAQFISKCSTNCHLCVFGIMTHGYEDDLLLMTDGELISKTRILDCFSSVKCEALKKVPKIFLMVFCRGTGEAMAQYQRALTNHFSRVRKSSAATDSQILQASNAIGLDASPLPGSNITNPVIRLETEMLEYGIAYSTYKGFPSVRFPENGTLFIRTFCEVMTTFFQMEDFGSMLTRVKRYMQSVAPEVNLSNWESDSDQIVEYGIPCKWDPYFSNTLYLVSNPKPLSKQVEEELENHMENFMQKIVGPVGPVTIEEGEIETDRFSDKRTLSCCEEIISKIENIKINSADVLSEVSLDGCIIVRLLFKREIFSMGGEYPNKFSFLFRDEKFELPIFSYGTSGAKLFHKLKKGKLYLIRDTIIIQAEQGTSPLGRGEVQVVMKPECIREVQLNERQMLLHNIPTYLSYKFSLIEDVINTTTQEETFFDIIGRLQHRMEKNEYFNESTGDTILLIGPSEQSIEVVVWNDYCVAIPEYGDVVAIRHGKLWKGNLPRKLSVNTNSFIQKIDNPEQLPPSQRKFFNALPELPPRVKRPRISV